MVTLQAAQIESLSQDISSSTCNKDDNNDKYDEVGGGDKEKEKEDKNDEDTDDAQEKDQDKDKSDDSIKEKANDSVEEKEMPLDFIEVEDSKLEDDF